MDDDYEVWCHHDDHRGPGSGMHKRSTSRLYGTPEWGGLWHCPEHQPTLTSKRRRGHPVLSCNCPYDPEYGDTMADTVEYCINGHEVSRDTPWEARCPECVYRGY